MKIRVEIEVPEGGFCANGKEGQFKFNLGCENRYCKYLKEAGETGWFCDFFDKHLNSRWDRGKKLDGGIFANVMVFKCQPCLDACRNAEAQAAAHDALRAKAGEYSDLGREEEE